MDLIHPPFPKKLNAMRWAFFNEINLCGFVKCASLVIFSITINANTVFEFHNKVVFKDGVFLYYTNPN